MKTIYLKGDIGFEITADKIREVINEKSTEKLQVLVNSSGGLVFEAFEIFNLFKAYKGQVEMVIMPYAASAASYIVMAGDKISAFKNSIWMGHRVSSVAIGDADEMLTTAHLLQSLEDVVIEAYQTRLSGEKEEIREKMRKELWLIGWEQLTENGVIDNVIDSIDEVYIEEDYKEEIEQAIAEASKDNASKILAMRLKKTETRMKNENIDFHNQYERVAAKLDTEKLKKEVYNPYPNEHAARVREPGDFEDDSFRRQELEDAEGISIIIGRLKGQETTTTQSYRFSIENWTADEARQWLEENDIDYIKFEPATGESDTGEKPVDDKTNNTGENMNLQEFLKSNPEAKAEYDKTLESAKAEGKEKAAADTPQNEPVNTNAERQRIRDILRATGGVLTEASAKAIEDGISPQEFAYNELVNQKTNADKPENKVDFGELLKNQLPGEQDKSGAEEEKKKAEAFDNALEAAKNKRKGGK